MRVSLISILAVGAAALAAATAWTAPNAAPNPRLADNSPTALPVDVEAHLAVGHQVEAGTGLVRNQGRDRVAILLAVDRIAVEGIEERAPAVILGEPARARQRAGDRGGKRPRLRGDEHDAYPSSPSVPVISMPKPPRPT